MSFAEYRDWQRFYAVEPWGCEVEDHRAGTIAAALYAVNMSKGEPPKPLDFFPRDIEAAKERVADEDYADDARLRIALMEHHFREQASLK